MAGRLLLWGALNCVLLVPLIGLYARRRYALVPLLLYGTGLYASLVVGLPLIREPGEIGGALLSFNGGWAYLTAIALASLPLYIGMMVPVGALESRDTMDAEPLATRMLFAALWASCSLAAIYYMLVVGRPPLFSGLSLVESASIYALRMSATYTERYPYFAFLFYDIAAVAALLGHCLYRKGQLGRWLNVASIVAAALLSLFFLHKSYIVALVIKLFILEAFLRGATRKRVITGLGFGAIALVSMYFLYMRSRPVGMMLESLLLRISTPYAIGFDFILSEFPRNFSFFGGKALPNPGGLLPFDPVSLSSFLMLRVRGSFTGTMPAPALAGWYANVGWSGLVFGLVLLSGWLFVLVWALRFALRTPVRLALWITFAFNTVNFSMQGFFAALDLRLLALAGAVILAEIVLRDLLAGSVPSGEAAAASG